VIVSTVLIWNLQELSKDIQEKKIWSVKNDGEIGIILPETDQLGSQALIKRLLNLIDTHPPFKSDDVLKPYLQTLSFQSFTYPDQFAIPESLKAVIEEDKESLFH